MTVKTGPYPAGFSPRHAGKSWRKQYRDPVRVPPWLRSLGLALSLDRDTWTRVLGGLRDQLGLLHAQTPAEADADLIEVQAWMLSVRTDRIQVVALSARLRTSTLALDWLVGRVRRETCPLVLEFRQWMLAEGLA
jgi:hypothetical protein